MLGGLLGACAPAAAPTTTGSAIKVTDALGREVTFQKPPERIVMTGKAFFMIVDAVYLFPAAAQRVAAIGATSQSSQNFLALIDPAYAAKATLESNAGAEQIAPLKPDLVILKSAAAEKLGKPLEQLNIPVVYVDLETPAQYTRDLTLLGQILGTPDRAKQILDYYQSAIERVKQAVAGVADDQKPRVLVLQYSDKGGAVAFSVPPATWIQTTMVTLAGGTPLWTEASDKGGWTVVGLEQIAAWQPDQIYVISYASDAQAVVEKLKADAKWQALPAVKAGQLFGFAGDFYSWDQPDTRWGLGVLWLATKIHPDLTRDIDIRQEVARFYSELYGLKPDAIQAQVMPLLTGSLP
jgi:iron complex transport system substrate-binding protein